MYMKHSIMTIIYAETLINQAADSFASSRFRESGIDGVPMDDDSFSKTDVMFKLGESKRILAEHGMNIAGWVSPSSVLNEKCIGLLEKEYDFGYTKYYGHYEIEDTVRPYNTKMIIYIDCGELIYIIHWTI